MLRYIIVTAITFAACDASAAGDAFWDRLSSNLGTSYEISAWANGDSDFDQDGDSSNNPGWVPMSLAGHVGAADGGAEAEGTVETQGLFNVPGQSISNLAMIGGQAGHTIAGEFDNSGIELLSGVGGGATHRLTSTTHPTGTPCQCMAKIIFSWVGDGWDWSTLQASAWFSGFPGSPFLDAQEDWFFIGQIVFNPVTEEEEIVQDFSEYTVNSQAGGITVDFPGVCEIGDEVGFAGWWGLDQITLSPPSPKVPEEIVSLTLWLGAYPESLP